MITDILTLTRPLICADVETTGLDTDTARIVELGFQAWYPDKPVKEWRTLVNPGITIPEETTRVHSISNATLALCATCNGAREEHDDAHPFKVWPTFKQLAPSLAKGFTGCDWMGKNIRFDLRVLASEFERAGISWSYAGARIIDADRLEQLGEPRHLSNLYKKHVRETCSDCEGKGSILDAPQRGPGTYWDRCPTCGGVGTVGKSLEDAHQALADVRATTEVIEAQLQTYTILPRDLDLLHKAQWPEEWLDGKGQFKLVNGVPTCTFGKHKGKAMRDVPVDYYDWILRPDVNMPADVKALASKAKLGEFPS